MQSLSLPGSVGYDSQSTYALEALGFQSTDGFAVSQTAELTVYSFSESQIATSQPDGPTEVRSMLLDSGKQRQNPDWVRAHETGTVVFDSDSYRGIQELLSDGSMEMLSDLDRINNTVGAGSGGVLFSSPSSGQGWFGADLSVSILYPNGTHEPLWATGSSPPPRHIAEGPEGSMWAISQPAGCGPNGELLVFSDAGLRWLNEDGSYMPITINDTLAGPIVSAAINNGDIHPARIMRT